MSVSGEDDRLVIVLGMHRSGTSVFTRCLATTGLRLADRLLDPDPEVNPDGFFEDTRVVALNDELLARAGRSWMDYRPCAIDPDDGFAAGWHREALTHVRRTYCGHARSIVKDPRLCRTWPSWLGVFEEAGLDVAVVHLVRGPMAVAASLKRRDALPLDYGLLLWMAHTLAAAQAVQAVARSATVAFDALLATPEPVVAATLQALGLDSPSNARLAEAVQVLDRPASMGHARADATVSDDLAAFAASLYDSLTVPDGETADLNAVWSRWQQLLARYDHRWEALREAAGGLQSLSQRLVEIGESHRRAQQTVAERDAQLAQVNEQLQRLGHEYGYAEKTVTERDRQLAELNGRLETLGNDHVHAQRIVAERDAQLAQVNEQLQRLGREYDHAEKTVTERDQQLAELNDRLEKLGDEHTHAQRIVAERDAQLAQVNEQLQRLGREHDHAEKTVVERDRQLAELNDRLEKLGSEHAHAQRIVVERDAQLAQANEQLQHLRQQLDRLRASRLGRLALRRTR